MGGLPARSTIIGSSAFSALTRGLRRNGAAGLDPAWLAAGRFDFIGNTIPAAGMSREASYWCAKLAVG